MALTAAGRRLLERGVTGDLFEELIERDPSAEQGLIPWEGRSPRGLTRVAVDVKLVREDASLNEVDAQIEEQCRRHLQGWD